MSWISDTISFKKRLTQCLLQCLIHESITSCKISYASRCKHGRGLVEILPGPVRRQPGWNHSIKPTQPRSLHGTVLTVLLGFEIGLQWFINPHLAPRSHAHHLQPPPPPCPPSHWLLNSFVIATITPCERSTPLTRGPAARGHLGTTHLAYARGRLRSPHFARASSSWQWEWYWHATPPCQERSYPASGSGLIDSSVHCFSKMYFKSPKKGGSLSTCRLPVDAVWAPEWRGRVESDDMCFHILEI